MNLRFLAASVLVLAAVLLACRANPSIDGASVPAVGSASAPPTCEQVCDRLARLCGYAPVSCLESCAAEADEGARLCRGQAASCREALTDCAPAASDGGTEESDGGTEDADAAAEPITDAGVTDAGDGG